MIKKMQFKITKKGRKWFEGINDVYTKGVQIEINENSKDWNVGDVVEFVGRIEKESSRFGTTIKIYPMSEQDALNEELKRLEQEYKRWKEYIEEAKEKGYVYENGVNELRKIAHKIGVEKEKEAEEYIKSVKEEVKNIQARSRFNSLLSYIEDASYSKFLDYYKELKELAEKYPFLKEKLEQKTEQLEQKKIKKLIQHTRNMIAKYDSDFKKRDKEYEEKIESYIQKIPDINLQAELREKLHEIGKEKDEERKRLEEEFKQKYIKVFESLSQYFSEDHIRAIIKHTERKYPVYNEPYIYVEPPKKYLNYITHKCEIIVASNTAIFLSEIDNFEDEIKEFDEPTIIKTEKNYLYFVPESKKELYDKIAFLIENPEHIYKWLQQLQGKEVDIEARLPSAWNHIKKQYVAIVEPDMTLTFISRLYNFTSSGANAHMDWSLPTQINSIIVAKDGSYKHMEHKFYKLTETGWQYIWGVEAYEWRDVMIELIDTIIEKGMYFKK